MSDQLYQQILNNFERKPTAELKRILANAGSGEWSDDGLKAAAAVLAGRPEDPDPDEPPAEATDRRGQAVFALSPGQIENYRLKIHILGWLICTAGAINVLTLLGPWILNFFSEPSIIDAFAMFGPAIFGFFSRAFAIDRGTIVIVIGLFFVYTGIRLIKLRAGSRIEGLVASALLLPFFPVGTIIGFFGLLWLGKRGSVLKQPPGGR